MNFDGNTLKIGLLSLLTAVCFLRANSKLTPFQISRGWLAVFLTFAVLLIHYVYIGDSVTSATNEILLCGAILLALSACAANAFSPQALMRGAIAMYSVPMLLFVLVNLIPALTGQEDAFIDGNYAGTTANANMLGAYLALCGFPLFLHGAVVHHNRTLRGLFWGALGACCVLIWLTRSRAALLVVGVCAVFLVLTSPRLRRSRKLMFIAVIVGTAAVATIQAGDKYGEAELLSTRGILILQRVAAITERPGLGWGFNSDVYNYYDDSNIFPAMEKGNTVLQAFEEFGVPLGLFVVLGLYALVLKVSLKLRKEPGGLAFSAALVGCATHLMFETWLFNFPALLSIYFWTMLLVAAHTQDRARTASAAVSTHAEPLPSIHPL